MILGSRGAVFVENPFSLSPLGLAKRCADVRSPERACRSELELASKAAKCVGTSLEGDSPIEHFMCDPRRAVHDL